LEQHSVVITGLADNIEGVNFVAGQSVYYDATIGLNQSNVGSYFGYALRNDSMIVRPDFIDNPTVKRKYEAESLVNNKFVQVDALTNKVSSLPLKTQGVEITTILNSFPTTNSGLTFTHLKDNIILCTSYNSSTYKGYLQLFKYGSTITQLGSDTLFLKNKVIGIKSVQKLSDEKLIIIFNDNDETQGLTYAIGATIDYSNNSFLLTAPIQLDDMLTVSNEFSYLYPINENKILHVYHDDMAASNGFTKGQIITFDFLANTLSKTTPTILQNGILTTNTSSLLKMGDKFVFNSYTRRYVDSNYYLTSVVFTVDATTDTISLLLDNNVLNSAIASRLTCKQIDNSHFLIAYSADTYNTLYLSIGTVNSDNTVTLGARYLNTTTDTSYLFDDILNSNLFFYSQNSSKLNCIKYIIDIPHDTITYTSVQSSGILVGESFVFKIGYNSYLIKTEDTIKKIAYTNTNFGGFYHNGYIYFSGFCPKIDSSIVDGTIYYWDKNGNYTTIANSGNNPVLGMGLSGGLYIFDKTEKIPSDITYQLTTNITPINEIKPSQTKTLTITKLINGVTVSENFTFSINYMGNATAMVSIMASTSNSVSVKLGGTSYTGKTFTVNCTDTTTGTVTSQLITVKSLF
jgi:hypothetical protein